MTAGVARRDGSVAWAPVRRHMRAVRRSHGGRSTAAVLSTAYEWLLYVVVAGGVLVTSLQSGVAAFAEPPGGFGPLLGAVAVLAATGAAGHLLLAVGPVVVGPAPASWLLPSPVDRSRWLRGRAVAVVTGTVAAGAASAGLLAAARGGTGWLWVAAGGASSSLLLATLCVAAQGAARFERALRSVVNGALLLALSGAVLLIAAVRLDATAPTWALSVPPVPAVVVPAVLALLTGPYALRALGRASGTALTRGTPLVAGLSVGSSQMDGSILSGVLQDRRLRQVAVVRSRRHRPGRRTALLQANVYAALRNGPAWGWAVGLAVATWLAALLVPPTTVPAVQLVGATLTAGRFAGSLRVVAGSAALRRTLGGSDRELLALHCVVPLVAAVVWTVAVAPVAGSLVSLLLLPVSAVAVVVRHATRPERTGTATLLDTPFGTFPVETIRDVSRGPLLLVVLVGVQLLAA